MADPDEVKNGKNKWLVSVITIITIVIGGVGVYFTQYLWASARQTEKNTSELCIVKSEVKEAKTELKNNFKEDQKLKETVIEMGGDIKHILSIVKELKKEKH